MFVATFHKVKSLDPTRTCSASYDNHTLDMNVYHHPITLKRIQDTKNEQKPVFFDEVLGVFHGWEDMAIFEDLDLGCRDYWVTGIADILRAIDNNENQVGANQWAWVDDTFLVPGKGIDCWRRAALRLLGPKMELAYDRGSGELYRALADRETVVTLGPKLHLCPEQSPGPRISGRLAR
jgi:hypothetical protein